MVEVTNKNTELLAKTDEVAKVASGLTNDEQKKVAKDFDKKNAITSIEGDGDKRRDKYEIVYDFSEGMAKVGNKEKYGFVDKNGKEIVSPKYEGAGDFRGGMAAVKMGEKRGFIDMTGKEVIPLQYDYAGHFGKDGLATVGKTLIENGLTVRKFGFIDSNGKEITPLKYNNAGDFKGGKAKVQEGEREFYIDKDGKETSGE